MKDEASRRKRTVLSGASHQTKNAMASKEAEYEVLVDNVVAKENVSRFVMHQGYQVNVEEQGDDFLLKITK